MQINNFFTHLRGCPDIIPFIIPFYQTQSVKLLQIYNFSPSAALIFACLNTKFLLHFPIAALSSQSDVTMPRGIETKQNSSCSSVHIFPFLGLSSALACFSMTRPEG